MDEDNFIKPKLNLKEQYKNINYFYSQVSLNYIDIQTLIIKNKLKYQLFCDRFINRGGCDKLSNFLSCEISEINSYFYNYLNSCHALFGFISEFDRKYDGEFDKSFRTLETNKHAIIKLVSECRNGLHHNVVFSVVGNYYEVCNNSCAEIGYELTIKEDDIRKAVELTKYFKSKSKSKQNKKSKDSRFAVIEEYIDSLPKSKTGALLNFEKLLELHYREVKKYVFEFEKLLKESIRRN